ncbi:MAG: hypothetical protein ACOC2K_02420 [Bacteroidota bacterium]
MFKVKYSLLAFCLVFVFALTSCDEDDPTEPQHEHFEAEGIVLYQDGAKFLEIFEAEFDENLNQSISVQAGSETDVFEIKFLDHDRDEILPEDDDKTFGYLISDESIAGLSQADGGWKFKLEGISAGTTELELRIMHEGHPDFKTPKIPVVVE